MWTVFLKYKFGKINDNDIQKSNKFSSDQIDYVHKAISYFKGKLNSPVFFLWSKNIEDLRNRLKFRDIIFINNEHIKDDIDRIHCDLFLMTNCKHFAVIPSAFNWWGCWLSNNKNSIILRPNNSYFTNLDIKNKDYKIIFAVPEEPAKLLSFFLLFMVNFL